jgi:hypothetical protein
MSQVCKVKRRSCGMCVHLPHLGSVLLHLAAVVVPSLLILTQSELLAIGCDNEASLNPIRNMNFMASRRLSWPSKGIDS